MNPEDIYEEWNQGESNGMRPQRVKELRDELRRITGLNVPRRIAEIESLMSNPQMRGQFTRKLREAVGDDEPVEDEE